MAATKGASAMFISAEDLQAFTGYKSAGWQARFLTGLGMTFVRRTDGSIALRRAELDAHTLSARALSPPLIELKVREPQLMFDNPARKK